jgi:hypothetical protein
MESTMVRRIEESAEDGAWEEKSEGENTDIFTSLVATEGVPERIKKP